MLCPLQRLWRSHHLQAQCDLLFRYYTHLSVTNVGKQQWATDRRAGTCQHAEHCTLFWHNRNACFPTEALDTKHVLTTVLLDDNREVYVILQLCNQKISTPLSSQSRKHGGDCALLEKRYPTSLRLATGQSQVLFTHLLQLIRLYSCATSKSCLKH